MLRRRTDTFTQSRKRNTTKGHLKSLLPLTAWVLLVRTLNVVTMSSCSYLQNLFTIRVSFSSSSQSSRAPGQDGNKFSRLIPMKTQTCTFLVHLKTLSQYCPLDHSHDSNTVRTLLMNRLNSRN